MGKVNKKVIIAIGLIVAIVLVIFLLNKDVATKRAGKLAFPTRDSSSILMDNGKVFIIYGFKAQIFNPETNKFKAIDSNYKVSLQNQNQILIEEADSTPIGTAQVKNIPQQAYDLIMIRKIIREENLNRRTDRMRSALLPNGKILVTNAGYKINNKGERVWEKAGFGAELCDPRKKLCKVIGKVNPNISFNYNILLNNGNVLILAGKITEVKAKREANVVDLIYDYKLDKFIPASNNRKSVYLKEHILLENGDILISGRDIDGLVFIERFNPHSKTFKEIEIAKLSRYSLVPLQDGKVLFLRNSCDPSISNNSKIFDPENNSFNRVKSKMKNSKSHLIFSGPRCGFSKTLLPSGHVLLTGGQIGTGGFSMEVNDMDIYMPDKNIFIRKKLQNIRYSHEAVLLKDDRVLIIGGELGGNALNSAEIFEEK